MDRIGSVTVGDMARSGDGTDWRLIYVSDPSSMTNYDFDPGHPRPLITTQPTTVEELRRVADNIALSGADTLIQEVYNAAWTMFFRSERFEYDARPQHRRFIPLMDQGIMPLQVLLERARQRGMGFMAGFRMNDSHGAPDQGGMFLHTHPEWKLTEMPDGAAFVPGNRMDFTFDGVRDLRVRDHGGRWSTASTWTAWSWSSARASTSRRRAATAASDASGSRS